MNVTYALLLSFIAGFSTLIGALLIFLKIPIKYQNKFISLALCFSMCIMIGVSLTDLLPSAYFTLYRLYNYKVIFLIILLFIISFFFIKIIHKTLNHYENNLYKLGILSMITLIIHNFPEGIITMLTSYINPSLGLKLSLAIAIHNIPEGISIALPIYYAKNSKKKALTMAFLSGMSEPLGGIIAFFFLRNFINDTFIAVILLLVSGLMITLAIEEIYPEIKKYNEKKTFYLGIIISIIFLLLNIILAL